MADVQTGLPGVPEAPISEQDGRVSSIWYQFFLNLWNRTGGSGGTVTLILDNISSTVGAMLVRGASIWEGLNPGADDAVLKSIAGFPTWDYLDGDSFLPVSQNLFLAGPATAGFLNPTFRSIVPADLPAGQYPGTGTNDNANAGNVGQYLELTGAIVPLISGGVTDLVSLNLTAGDWDVWGSLVTSPNAATTTSEIKGWLSATSATDPGAPNQGAYSQCQFPIPAGLAQTLPVGSMRITLGAPATVYLSAKVTFAVNTMSSIGFMAARRRR